MQVFDKSDWVEDNAWVHWFYLLRFGDIDLASHVTRSSFPEYDSFSYYKSIEGIQNLFVLLYFHSIPLGMAIQTGLPRI